MVWGANESQAPTRRREADMSFVNGLLVLGFLISGTFVIALGMAWVLKRLK